MRHQRGQSEQRGPCSAGEREILGVRVGPSSRIVVEFSGNILGGYESVHRILIHRQVRLQPCARFATFARLACASGS